MHEQNGLHNKAYFGIKFHEDSWNRSEIDSICAALQNDGIQTVCVAGDIEKWNEIALSPEELMRTLDWTRPS